MPRPAGVPGYTYYPGPFRVVARNGGPMKWQLVKGGGARGLLIYGSYKTLDAAVRAGQRLNPNGKVQIEYRAIASLDHNKLQ